MKICLIRPSVIHNKLALSHMPVPPIGIAYIGSYLLKFGHKVQIIDAAAEGFYDVEPFKFGTYIFGLSFEKIYNKIEDDVDIIAVSCMYTSNWLYDREFLKFLKSKFPDKILIIGGEHASAAPSTCLNQVPGINYIVLGEGEATLSELVDTLEKGESINDVSSIYFKDSNGNEINNSLKKPKRIADLDSIPWPAWHLFQMNLYFQNKVSYGVYKGNSLPIMASRGCPYECTFCSSPQMWGRKYQLRDVNDFVNEIEYWQKKYDIVNFDFFDLTAIIKKDWFLKLCNEIIARKIKITYQIPAGTRIEAIDQEVTKKLVESGCSNITFAPESGSERVLKEINKKLKIKSLLNAIKWSNSAGMNIKLNIIVGFPKETHLDCWKTISFLIKASWYGSHDMYPAVFSPYPGSELFEYLSKNQKVNIDSDEYILELIKSHDLWPGKTYSEKMSDFSVRSYTLLYFFFFYGSQFLFRPIRIYYLIKNLWTGKHESRAELVLYQTYKKFILSKKVPNSKKVSENVF